VLRVLTLNIWNLNRWRERRQEVVRWFDLLQADLVCLQEVVDNQDGRNQAGWLAQAASAGYHWAYGPVGSVAPGTSFGNALLSRWPIDDQAVIRLPSITMPGEVDRGVLHARTNGLDLFCTHLSSPYEVGFLRETQVVRLVDVIEGRAAPKSRLPPILAGDFNAEPDSTEIRYLSGLTSLGGRSAYYQDAWRVAGDPGPGWTWDNRNRFAALEHEPDRRIDYVFVGWRRPDGAGRVETARVVCNRVLDCDVHSSDHFGLLVQIRDD